MSHWLFTFSLVLPFGLACEPYKGGCTEANAPAMQNLHVFTVPLQFPYSALTVPLQFPYVTHTVPLPHWGLEREVGRILTLSQVW